MSMGDVKRACDGDACTAAATKVRGRRLLCLACYQRETGAGPVLPQVRITEPYLSRRAAPTVSDPEAVAMRGKPWEVGGVVVPATRQGGWRGKILDMLEANGVVTGPALHKGNKMPPKLLATLLEMERDGVVVRRMVAHRWEWVRAADVPQEQRQEWAAHEARVLEVARRGGASMPVLKAETGIGAVVTEEAVRRLAARGQLVQRRAHGCGVGVWEVVP